MVSATDRRPLTPALSPKGRGGKTQGSSVPLPLAGEGRGEGACSPPAGEARGEGTEAAIWALLERVPDPEIPVLSVIDLGIVRHVRVGDGGAIEVGVTPTYSGCPATEVIRSSIAHALRDAGYAHARTVDVLSPPWTSDWITPAGRDKLRRFGIAPPAAAVASPRHLFGAPRVACPRCGSEETERVSEFGSTPCKAHYQCRSCAEPFDYFKCI